VTLSAKSAPISSTPPSSGSSHTSGSSPIGGSSGPKAEGATPFAGDPPAWDPNNPMNRTFGAAPGKKGVREGLPGFGSGGGGELVTDE
jgi:ATP-dependent Clp protease ATP-binding subunit ClpX